MPGFFLLFSHTLTPSQIADAEASLGVRGADLRSMPEDLQRRFSNVPPELETLDAWLQPLHDWLRQQAHPSDYALVQGDFGAVVNLSGGILSRDRFTTPVLHHRAARGSRN